MRSPLFYTAPMRFSMNTYIPKDSCVHACDARVKIVLLLAYSITLFFVETWAGLGLCAALFAAALAASRIAPARVFGLAAPVYVLVAFAILVNSFTFDVSVAAQPVGLGAVSAGVLANAAPVSLAGNFAFVPAGFARGCFYAVRILLLVFASFIVCFSTTSTAMTSALASFLAPLRRVRVPVDDIATVLSVALRFIPLTAEELMRVRDAQWARGARFDEGGLWQRLRAWQTVFIPVLVALFRRADRLAQAMESRCYGNNVPHTTLHTSRISSACAFALAGGIAVCVALGFFL